ncbi:MAG: DUF5691 domain-containing protein [Pirellula sp.]|jgi:hypothetical protein|nr:DUF5691 domain-containing protein [Pirellula sp.]
MTTDLLKSLDDLKGIWLMGGSAIDRAPKLWQDAVRDLEQQELALVALAGQAISFALQPMPTRQLVVSPILPALPLPATPEPARQMIRFLLKVVKLTEAQMADVIRLLTARGYAVNPIDYMPRNYSQLPDLYSVWEAWDRAEKAPAAGTASAFQNVSALQNEIDAENWDQWLPAERRMALAELRRQRPREVRELLADKLPTLPAEERFRILELFNDNLCPEDQAFLEGLMQDRSSKVKQLAQSYLARLGVSTCLDEDSIEFAQFFTATNVDLNGILKITANPLKTPAQKKRRAVLASKLSLQCLATGLKIASEEQLVHGWDHVDPQASDEFVRMVAATGSEKSVASLARRIESLDGISAEALQLLFQRLSPQVRRELLPRVLSNDDATFAATLMCCGNMLGEIAMEQLVPTLAFNELLKICREEASANVLKKDKLRQGLYTLGLIAKQSAASELLKMFTNAGLFASDPLLSVLKLNTCLPHNDCLPRGDDL